MLDSLSRHVLLLLTNYAGIFDTNKTCSESNGGMFVVLITPCDIYVSYKLTGYYSI